MAHMAAAQSFQAGGYLGGAVEIMLGSSGKLVYPRQGKQGQPLSSCKESTSYCHITDQPLFDRNAGVD